MLYDDIMKAKPIIEDTIANPQNITTNVMQILGIFHNLETGCGGIFSFAKLTAFYEHSLVAFDQQKKLSKIPAIGDIIACISAVKPFATDIYDAVVSFTKGETQKGVDAIEKAAIDAVSLGMSCYKVIDEILSDSKILVAVTQQKKKLAKIPDVGDILACVKAVKPFATDIYEAVIAFTKGETQKGIDAIEKAAIDAVSLGMSCYKVIEEILADK